MIGPAPTNILFYSKYCMALFLLGPIRQLESSYIHKIFSGWGISLGIWRQLQSSPESIEIKKSGQFWVVRGTMSRSYYCVVWYASVVQNNGTCCCSFQPIYIKIMWWQCGCTNFFLPCVWILDNGGSWVEVHIQLICMSWCVDLPSAQCAINCHSHWLSRERRTPVGHLHFH